MKLKETFYLNRLRCEIAMEQAMGSWTTPASFGGKECPKCQSRNFGKFGRLCGKPRFLCKDCGCAFTERPLFVCTCQVPGKLSKCQDCPNFQQWMVQVEQIVEELRGLSQEELEGLRAS